MGSAIRAMLRNERYTGRVVWNSCSWIKDPDSGKRKRRMRPRSEWVTRQDESLRIISDALFDRAQRRTRLGNDERLKSGGKAKYLLSGLLVCDVCGSHYVIADPRSYACSSHVFGRACNNSIRVTRKAVEAAILEPIRRDLLSPERVQRMAKEMQRAFAERARAAASRSAAAPKELQDIDARLGRLRERLRQGDPDLEPDELQAAIDQAEDKRKELLAAQPEAKASAKLLTMLPRAAELYRQQIAQGLDGDPRAALKARVILRDLLGKVRLVPGAEGSLWAQFKQHPAALLLRGAGTCGSGGRLRVFPTSRRPTLG